MGIYYYCYYLTNQDKISYLEGNFFFLILFLPLNIFGTDFFTQYTICLYHLHDEMKQTVERQSNKGLHCLPFCPHHL